MDAFYMSQNVKPSAASTFNQTDLVKSTKLVSKTRSFRAKLKSKILKPRVKSIRKQQQQNNTEWSSFNISDQPSQHQQNAVVTAICKIMNKSLGLFKASTKKTKKFENIAEYLATSFNDLVFNSENETQCSISIDQLETHQLDYSGLYQYTDSYLISTPKKNSQLQKQSLKNEIYQMEKISIHEVSVQEQQQVPAHSTPANKRLLSPIYVSLTRPTIPSAENSYLSSSSIPTTTSSVSLISGNRLKSFGMTSSPMSVNSLKNSVEINYNQDNSSSSLNMSDSFNDIRNYKEIFLSNQPQTQEIVNENELNSNEQKLIRHLNNIKRNVRLSVELRDVESNRRNLYNMGGDNIVTMSSKKRRLQNIFRSKIHRQLKEIKTWRIGFRNKLELSRVNNNEYNNDSCNFQYCQCNQNY